MYGISLCSTHLHLRSLPYPGIATFYNSFRLDKTEHELSQLKKEKSTVEQRILELQTKSADHEQREYEAALQVRDSVQMVESAMLEKDQVGVGYRGCMLHTTGIDCTLASPLTTHSFSHPPY